MRLSEELFRAAEPHFARQLGHPFVQGLGNGNLEQSIFVRWILQDYLYLQDYARVFAWAAAKAPDLESMGWYARVLHLTLNTEMELHRRYAARFGLTSDDLEHQEPWPTTRSYTDFLVRTAAEGDILDLLAALLPCTWGYVYLARALMKAGPPQDQRYADWIAQYASDEFAEALDWLRGELDRLSHPVPETKKNRLRRIFLRSVEYEWAFWEMCWHGESF
jgi:thiaminase/transcriptional activator TenA